MAHEHQLAEVDFLLVTEMTLRLAMVLESSADVPPQSGRKTGTKVQVFFLFVTYSIIQDIISSEM